MNREPLLWSEDMANKLSEIIIKGTTYADAAKVIGKSRDACIARSKRMAEVGDKRFAFHKKYKEWLNAQHEQDQYDLDVLAGRVVGPIRLDILRRDDLELGVKL